MSDGKSIWSKIDLDEYVAAVAAQQQAKPEAETKATDSFGKRAIKKIYWLVLKFIAVAFWVYVPLKLVVGDVDRWIVQNIAPSIAWLLDYRFFFFLALLSIGLVVLRRWTHLGAIFYILLFPVIVALFYVPRVLFRQETWMPTIGLLNALWVTVRSLRFAVVSFSLFATATLFISVEAASPLQVLAVSVLLALWATLLIRGCIASVRPVSFIRAQQRAIAHLQDSRLGLGIAAPYEGHMKPEVVKLTKAEIDQVVMTASGAVCLYGLGYFYADQLEKYRKSGPSVIFSVLGVALLLVQAVAIFSMVNVGLHHVDSSQFTYSSDPSFATFVRYALYSLIPGDVGAIQPRGQAATWVSIFAGLSVGVILLVLVVALIFSVRAAREDSAATESLAQMRVRSDAYADRLVTEYGLPLSELVQRLVDMGGLVNLWFRFVSDRIGLVRKESAGSSDAK